MYLAKDLSHYHEPVGDLLNDLNSISWEEYCLTDEQIQHFNEQGYISNIKLLENEQIDQLREELEEIMDPGHPAHALLYEFHTNESQDPDRVLFHCLGHWRMTPGFHDVLWNPALAMAASQIFGGKSVRFWHDQLFLKPAKHGGVVAWHQDYSYWTRTKPMQHLTAWIGLDDATTDNGCLHYIPGSHRWGLLNKPTLTGEMKGLTEFLTDEQTKALDKAIPIELKKGYATIHHPLLIHGSFENNSDRPRRAFVLNVFADGTCSDSDEALLEGVPVIHKGEKMEGQFFPLIYKSSDPGNNM
jgi:ectoine hydroxylase-related dioxygenase (phytanoyl-CoA dioxygenase family)